MTEEQRTCYRCKETFGLHMYHQKNRDGKKSRHRYCKFCRKADKLALLQKVKAKRAEESAKVAERWVIMRPVTMEDFIDGESMDDMKRRLGVNVSKFGID